MIPLYENIKMFRKKARMTQEELAKKTGYSDRSSIAKIEKGEVDLSQSKIKLFANALGTTPSVLMGWVSEDQSKKNDQLAELIVRLRRDVDLLETFIALSELPPEQYTAVKQLLGTLRK